jgi:hypothetical protein
MANIANPRKNFQFSISVPGLNPFLAQKVTLPEESIDVVEHGDTNYLVKTGGIRKVGKLVVEKIMFATGADNWLRDWMLEVQNITLGGGLLPSLYKRTIRIDQLSNDGVTIINTHYYYGCWPSKRDAIELDRTTSENTMEKIEFEVDEPIQQ